MSRVIIFLRKKIPGENSIEEYAYRIAAKTGAEIKICPYASNSFRNMMRNIKFAIANQGEVNHIITATECYLLPFLSGRKIITFHDLGTLYSSRNIIYRILKVLFYIKPAEFFADYITFVSQQTFKEFTDQQWCKHKGKVVIYNSYDDRLIPNDLSYFEDKPIILHIGTGARKNLNSVISAVRGLNVKLLIVGKLSEIQKKLLMENNTEFENYYDVSYSDIVTFYNRALIVSFPTFYEGFGLPVIEANVMQKPVFSSKIPIIEEISEGSVFYVDPYSIDSIHCAIKSLLYDKNKRQEMIVKGIQNAKRFSSRKILDDYIKLYFG